LSALLLFALPFVLTYQKLFALFVFAERSHVLSGELFAGYGPRYVKESRTAFYRFP
jgi:hypothetical protein